MRKLFYFLSLSLIIVLSNNSQAQKLNVAGLNTDNFNTVKAFFTVTDNFGNSTNKVNKSDFLIKENGKSVNALFDTECNENPPELSIMLIVDRSATMGDPSDTTNPIPGQTRYKDAKFAVKAFLEKLKFTGRTKVGLITFSGYFEYKREFTNQAQWILDSLDLISPSGPTNFNYALLDEFKGQGAIKLLGDQPADMKRIIIFLTDSDPTDIFSPQTKTSEIIQKCDEFGINFYSITLYNQIQKDLKKISDECRGKSFQVNDKDGLKLIYEQIADEIQKNFICNVSWKSEYSCDPTSLDRLVDIEFSQNGGPTTKVTKNYQVPANGFVKVNFGQSLYSFGDPDLGPANSVSKTITFVSENTPLNLNSFSFVPASTFFTVKSAMVNGVIVSVPFSINKGDTVSVEVVFTQEGQKDSRQSNLFLNSTPCTASIPIFGGITNVVLINPKTPTKAFRTCDAINIQWGGVEVDKPVNLYFSNNSGTNWTTIARNRVGFNYNWTPLPAPGNTYKVKAEVLPDTNFRWAKAIGNPSDNFGRSIDITGDGLFLWATGWYQTPTTADPLQNVLNFDNKTLQSAGGKDIWVAKFSNDGKVIDTYSFGGTGSDTATAICVDPVTGDAFITGSITGNINADVKFGTQSIAGATIGLPYFFVAKIPASGASPVVKILGAKSPYTTSEVWGTRIKFDNVNKKVIVFGFGKNQLSSNLDGIPINFNSTNASPFSIEFTPTTLACTNFSLGNINLTTFNKNFVAFTSTSTNTYTVGSFTGNRNFGKYGVTSAGMNDIFINKFGSVPGSSDISADFSIEEPKLVFQVSKVDLTCSNIGVPVDSTATKLLLNPTTLPIDFTYTITPANSGFSLINPPTTVLPGLVNAANLTINYQPKVIGTQNATLTITGACAKPISLALSGCGKCGIEVTPKYDIGKSNLAVPVTGIINKVFKNLNNNLVRINPKTIPNTEFKVIKMTANGSTTYTIGQAFDVDAYGEVDIEIEFTPTDEGIRTAQLDFGIDPNSGCSNVSTELTGLGVNSELTIYPLRFGLKRVDAKHTALLKIYNTSVNAASIDSVWFNDKTVFDVVGNSVPNPIPGKDTGRVAITFLPRAEINYKQMAYVRYNNGNKIDSVQVDGTGSLPIVNPTLICPNTTLKFGESGNATLRIANNSTNTDTKITRIEIQDAGDFTFLNGTKTLPVIPDVTKGGNIPITLNFTPQAAGKRDVKFKIYADNSKGNLTDDVYPIPFENIFDASCNAISPGGEEIVDFGGTLVCSQPLKTYSITNSDPVNDLVIFGPPDVKGNSPNFVLSLQNDLVIKPNVTETFTITFKPTNEVVYSANFDLLNNQNLKLKYVLSGKGVYIHHSSIIANDIKLKPGLDTMLYVSAKVAALDKKIQDGISIDVIYKADEIAFLKDNMGMYITPTTSVPSLTWSMPVLLSPGRMQLRASGTFQTPFDGNLCKLPYKIYLGSTTYSEISMQSTIYTNCSSPIELTTKITVDGVCFLEGRLVEISQYEFIVGSPQPNPANEVVKIDFSIPYDGPVEIELQSTAGSIVKTVNTSQLKAGVHSVEIPTSDLGTGVYFIKFKSLIFQDMKKVLIEK